MGEREERLREGECEYVYQDQPASQEQGETPDCNCASRGLLHYGRHGPGCPYGNRASKIAAEQIRERQRELDTGLRAPEGWEGDPQPLEALASSPSPPEHLSTGFRLLDSGIESARRAGANVDDLEEARAWLGAFASPPDREQAVEKVAEWIFEWSMEERAVFTKQDYYDRPWAEVDEHTKRGWREKAQHVIALALGPVRGDERGS